MPDQRSLRLRHVQRVIALERGTIFFADIEPLNRQTATFMVAELAPDRVVRLLRRLIVRLHRRPADDVRDGVHELQAALLGRGSKLKAVLKDPFEVDGVSDVFPSDAAFLKAELLRERMDRLLAPGVHGDDALPSLEPSAGSRDSFKNFSPAAILPGSFPSRMKRKSRKLSRHRSAWKQISDLLNA